MGVGPRLDISWFKPDDLRLSPQEQAVVTEFVRERNEDESEPAPAMAAQ